MHNSVNDLLHALTSRLHKTVSAHTTHGKGVLTNGLKREGGRRKTKQRQAQPLESLWNGAYCRLLTGTAAAVASCVMYVWCWLVLRLVVSLGLLSVAEGGGGMARGTDPGAQALDAGCVVTGLWPSSLLYSSLRAPLTASLFPSCRLA